MIWIGSWWSVPSLWLVIAFQQNFPYGYFFPETKPLNYLWNLSCHQLTERKKKQIFRQQLNKESKSQIFARQMKAIKYRETLPWKKWIKPVTPLQDRGSSTKTWWPFWMTYSIRFRMNPIKWQSLSLSLLSSFQKGPLCTIVKLINTNLFCISAKPIVETR